LNREAFFFISPNQRADTTVDLITFAYQFKRIIISLITAGEFSNFIFREFPYSPTPGQQEVIKRLADFVVSDLGQFPLFLLEGYAGTGKTTVVSTLVKALPKAGYTAILLAPTGRAAKVLSLYAQMPAYTIHKRLYRPAMDNDGHIHFQVMPNKSVRTLFIVDEASMIPDDHRSEDSGSFQSRNLLEDLIGHVFSGESCKMLFLGDSCQLPPVGIDQSPALDRELLRQSYYLDLDNYTLSDVVRQSLESGILSVATGIRQKINQEDIGQYMPLFGKENDFADVISITGMDMPDAMQQAFHDYGRENTVVITRSNKRANLFNQAIRERILFHESELAAGDHLMVVRNNYFWLPDESKAGFIANGDIVEVQSLRKTEELYGFRFAEATVRMVDYPDEPSFDVKLLLDTINSEGPALSYQENQRLFNEVMADYMDEPSRRKRMASIRQNPFYNALQVKHASALTCHKTQGGQWDAVFIEKGYLKDEMIDKEYLRWLYTAVTRATKKLFLINFEERFFE
jgi:exodeoxyribonuclease V